MPHPRRRRCPPTGALVLVVSVLVVSMLVVSAISGCTASTSASSKSAFPSPTASSPSASAIPSPSPFPSPTASSPSASNPSASSSPPSTALAEAACVAASASRLSLKEQVGQLIMVGTRLGGSPSTAGAAVRAYDLGGVFLAGRSDSSAAALRAMIAGFQKAAVTTSGVRLQISLDQEGGEVQTLKGPDFPKMPTAVTQGSWDATALRNRTVSASRLLTGIGVTLNLAPVADTVPSGTAPKNPPIGAFKRQYGSDPAAVASDIGTVVGAAQSTGLLVTLKHFPGLGRVTANTDTSTAVVDSVTTTHDPYLAPFAAGIKAGTGAVMISLALYPKIDPHNIAAFSPAIVTGLLRDQMHFSGLVISDDLGDAQAVAGVPVAQRAIRFVRAGGDIALTTSVRDAGVMARAMLAEARTSTAFAALVTNAAKTVLVSKYRAGLLTC